MTDTLIKVEHVSKKFCRSLKRSLLYGLQDLGSEILGRQHAHSETLRADEFWAVKDINFELRRGECLGLIGQNGAGKTTLLRMLNGLIKPDQGRIELRGRVGALIALGAGFSPILTGRENVYVNASVLGLSKREVDARIDEIIDFAEVRDFIDAPVQTYSSGMNVRLGFAVAAVLIKPDILLLDEVLAVGDIGFMIKCLNTVRHLSSDAAVVFVSHDMHYVSAFCTRVVVLEKGSIVCDVASPAEGIDRYFAMIPRAVDISGTGGAQLLGVRLIVDGACPVGPEPTIRHGADVRVEVRVQTASTRKGIHLVLYVLDDTMSGVICVPSQNPDGTMCELPCGTLDVEVPLGSLELMSGRYNIMVAVIDPESGVALTRVQGLSPFRVLTQKAYWAPFLRPAQPRVRVLGSDEGFSEHHEH
jgi:lipopolysaccharide transport system ATP-binding protein